MEGTTPSSHSGKTSPQSSSPNKKTMSLYSPFQSGRKDNIDEDDIFLRQAEKQRSPRWPPPTDQAEFLRGEGDSNFPDEVNVHRGALFGDAVPPTVGGNVFSKPKTQRKTGDALWKRELRTLFRQKWSWKQKKAIMRAMLRLLKTTGTQSAIVFIPETYNASTYATSGEFADFIRAWSAALAGMR